jgi:hypothetical protein
MNLNPSYNIAQPRSSSYNHSMEDGAFVSRSQASSRTLARQRFVVVERPLSEFYESYLGRFDMALSGLTPKSRRIYLDAARRFLYFVEVDLGLEAAGGRGGGTSNGTDPLYRSPAFLRRYAGGR